MMKMTKRKNLVCHWITLIMKEASRFQAQQRHDNLFNYNWIIIYGYLLCKPNIPVAQQLWAGAALRSARTVARTETFPWKEMTWHRLICVSRSHSCGELSKEGRKWSKEDRWADEISQACPGGRADEPFYLYRWRLCCRCLDYSVTDLRKVNMMTEMEAHSVSVLLTWQT